MHGLPELFHALYVTGAAGTVAYLAVLTSRRLPGWVWAHRPRTVGEWLLVPVEVWLGFLVAILIMMVTFIGWPAVLSVVIFVEKRRRAQRRALEEEEEEALLQEVRSLRGRRSEEGTSVRGAFNEADEGTSSMR